MLLHALIVASALAPAPDPVGDPAAPPKAVRGLDVVIVRAPEAEADAVGKALRVRLPDAQVLPFADESFTRVEGRAFVYVEVTRSRLLLVLSDGRAWVRDVPPDPDQPARAVATTIANTLTAIEEERLLPDRTEVAVPRPEPEPTPSAPEPTPEPVAPPPPRTAAPKAVAPPLEATPPLRLGLAADGLGLFGLAPTTPDARFAGGGSLRATLRLPIGVIVEADVRGTGRGRTEYRLLRLRGRVAAGYAWSRRYLELAATIGPTVEGWTLRDSDGRTTSTGPEGSRRPPLVGGALALAAGVLLPPAPRDRVQVRIGGRAELCASALPSGSAARIIDATPPVDAILFTAGGLEATLAAELTLWLQLRRAHR